MSGVVKESEMRHARVSWMVLIGLVLTAVVSHGQASVTLSPTGLIFSGQLLNTISLGKAVTLTNGGAAGLTITWITASGRRAATVPSALRPLPRPRIARSP